MIHIPFKLSTDANGDIDDNLLQKEMNDNLENLHREELQADEVSHGDRLSRVEGHTRDLVVDRTIYSHLVGITLGMYSHLVVYNKTTVRLVRHILADIVADDKALMSKYQDYQLSKYLEWFKENRDFDMGSVYPIIEIFTSPALVVKLTPEELHRLLPVIAVSSSLWCGQLSTTGTAMSALSVMKAARCSQFPFLQPEDEVVKNKDLVPYYYKKLVHQHMKELEKKSITDHREYCMTLYDGMGYLAVIMMNITLARMLRYNHIALNKNLTVLRHWLTERSIA